MSHSNWIFSNIQTEVFVVQWIAATNNVCFLTRRLRVQSSSQGNVFTENGQMIHIVSNEHALIEKPYHDLDFGHLHQA